MLCRCHGLALQDRQRCRGSIRELPSATNPREHLSLMSCKIQWNHLGHFAFIHYLLPLLKRTAQQSGSTSVRIVNVSSLGHTFCPSNPDFSSIEGANKEYGSTWSRYGLSKAANILFTIALQDRLKNDNIKVNCLHPGNVATTLTRGPQESYGFIARYLSVTESWFLMTPVEGAKTQTYLAASKEVDEKDYRCAFYSLISPKLVLTSSSSLLITAASTSLPSLPRLRLRNSVKIKHSLSNFGN